MRLEVNGKQTLSEISSAFTALFPYLKLVFFKVPHTKGKSGKPENVLDDMMKLETVTGTGVDDVIVFSPGMTVAELEKAFGDQLQLNVQVFRHSGKVWLETSSTDNRTLREQNQLGHDTFFPVEKPDPNDFDYD